MKKIFVFPICLAAAFVLILSVSSQAEKKLQRSKMSSINLSAEQGNIGDKTSSDLQFRISAHHNYADINNDGSVIAADGKLIVTQNGQYKVKEISGHDFYGVKLKLDSSGKTLSYLQQDQKNANINFMDTDTTELSAQYIHPKEHALESMIHFDISSNANTFLYSYFFGDGREKICIVDKEGKTFSKPHEVGVVELATHLFIDSSGQRVFINATVLEKKDYGNYTRTVNVYKSFWADRKGNEWQPAQPLKISGATNPIVIDHAKNGNLLLVNTEDNGIALIEWKKNEWSEPVFLGFKPHKLDRMDMSEDGNVIASTGFNPPSSAAETIDLSAQDFKLFKKDNNGKYYDEKINKDSSYIISSEFLLSKNGKNMVIIPYEITD